MATRRTVNPLVVATLGAKVHRHLAGLAAALELEITETGIDGQFRVGRGARAAQYLQGHHAVGRYTDHTAVFKLNFCFAIVGGRQLHAFKQRRVGHCLGGQHLIALRQLYLAVNKAQAHCPSGLPCTLLSPLLTCVLLSFLGRCHGK